MVELPNSDLLAALTAWSQAERAVQAAVLFGSRARAPGAPTSADGWSDVDLQILTDRPEAILRTDWARIFPAGTFCLQVLRPATGGVRKLTVLFSEGEADLVLVPTGRMRLARLALRWGWYRHIRAIQVGLDETATCLWSGYRLLKGEAEWGGFYARVARQMAGVRLTDDAIATLANVFLCDLSWVLQKLERGELAAAQYLLHRQLAETNFRLMRELRLRRGQPLPSFGIARRVETLLSAAELRWVTVDARLERDDLRRGASAAYAGLQGLMHELLPRWHVPDNLRALVERYPVKPVPKTVPR